MPSARPAAGPDAAARRSRDTGALRAVLPACEAFDPWVVRVGVALQDRHRLPAATRAAVVTRRGARSPAPDPA